MTHARRVFRRQSRQEADALENVKNDFRCAPSNNQAVYILPEMPADTGEDVRRLRRAFFVALSFTVLLWLIKVSDIIFNLDLVQYGVFPRRLSGLQGVVWAPLLHGSLSHVFSNTAPLIILGTTLLYGYPKSAKIVIPFIYSVSGLAVWLIARSSYHIGASGLVFGMMFFVFTIGILRWDKRAITLSLLVFFLYGGMIWGIFPSSSGVSFESHLAGAAIGILLAFRLKAYDPIPPPARYSWEDEEQDSEPEDL